MSLLCKIARALAPGLLAVTALVLGVSLTADLGPALAMIVSEIVIAALIILWMRRLHIQPAGGSAEPTDARWRPRRTPFAEQREPDTSPGQWLIFVASLIILTWITGQIIAMAIHDAVGDTAFDTTQAQLHSPAAILASLILMVIIAPIGEEAIVRGAMFTGLRTIAGPIATSGISAVVFSLMHANLTQIVLTTALGFILGLIRESTGRLREVIVGHMLFNGLSLLIPATIIQSLSSSIVAVLIAALMLIGTITVAPMVVLGPRRRHRRQA